MQCLSVLAGLLLAFSATAYSEPIHLVTGDDYKPFTARSLPSGGMVAEIIQRTLQEEKIDFELDWLPWKRGYAETKAGMYAGTFPYVKTPERLHDGFLFSEPIYTLGDRIFSRANSGLDANNLKTLENKKICIPLGWVTNARLVPMIDSGQLKMERPRDISTCVRMISAGRADFMVTDQFQGSAAIQDAGVKNVAMGAADALGGPSLHLIVPQAGAHSKALLDAFNNGLAVIKKNGEYNKIVAKYIK